MIVVNSWSIEEKGELDWIKTMFIWLTWFSQFIGPKITMAGRKWRECMHGIQGHLSQDKLETKFMAVDDDDDELGLKIPYKKCI